MAHATAYVPQRTKVLFTVSGGGDGARCFETAVNAGACRMLISYHSEVARLGRVRAIMEKRKNKIDLTIDSGAFSAWNSGKEVKLRDYMKFLEDHRDCYGTCVNLDVIPAAKGQTPSPRQINEACEAGWKNLLALRKGGFNPMPVYHLGESLDWLKKYVDAGFDYIGIGGTVGKSTGVRQAWFDQVFDYLCSGSGWPCVKTHAFGMTALPLLYRYPWYSADSLTWALVAGFGSIYVPRPDGEGGYDYDVTPFVVNMSDREKRDHNSAANDDGQNYQAMSKAARAYVSGWLKHEGFEVPDCVADYTTRRCVNARFFLNVEKNHVLKPFKRKVLGLFDRHRERAKRDAADLPTHVQVLFTMAESLDAFSCFNREKIQRVLLSYMAWEKIKGSLDVRDFAKTGKLPHIESPYLREKKNKARQ